MMSSNTEQVADSQSKIRNQWQETIPLFQRALNSSGIGGRKKVSTSQQLYKM